MRSTALKAESTGPFPTEQATCVVPSIITSSIVVDEKFIVPQVTYVDDRYSLFFLLFLFCIILSNIYII